MEHIYNKFPDFITGYELDPDRGYFSVVLPEAKLNMVTNPSVEGGVTTNYAAYGGALAATYNWQAYGACGLELTPAVSTESGFYYGSAAPVGLTSGATYTASTIIRGEVGKEYYIWFASTAGALIGTKRLWIGTGHKQMIWVTVVEPAGANRRVYVTRDGKYTDQNVFYADGLNVEASPYPTTHCDGDQKGFVWGQQAYYWNGLRGASTSTRSAQTRAGGREVRLLDLGFRVLAVLGLGMSSLVDQSLPLPGRGELAQGTGTVSREFTLVGAVYADGKGPRHLQSVRAGLINAFKPDLTVYDQPLILRYQACDENGIPTSDSLDILCKYRTGLEGLWDNNQQERISIVFKMHLPFLQNTWNSGVALGYQTAVPDFAYIGYRDFDGAWKAMGTGMDGQVNALVIGPDGGVYAGGSFTLAGGVANTSRIAKWNGSSWEALNTGLNSIVHAIAFGPDGSLYAAGEFTDAGGIANADRIAKWDGSAWSALGTGLNGAARTVTFDSDGNLYVGGTFTTAGGVGATRIAKWDGSVWTALGTGFSGGTVTRLLVGPDDYLYAGSTDDGVFGGVTYARGIAKWNGAAWSALGTGVVVGDGDVLALAFGLDGSLYAGGTFTVMGGASGAAYIAKWNGLMWSSVNAYMDNLVNGLYIGPAGELYAGGSFTTAGGYTMPDRVTVYRDGVWMPLDINVNDVAAVFYQFAVDRLGRLYVGGNWVETDATSATVIATNVGGSRAYPVVTWIGPGTIWQFRNYTTGKAIFFKNLTLSPGEIAILDLTPERLSFTSSFRGDLMRYVVPGSNLLLSLQSGSNNVSSFIFGSTTVATSVYMYWKDMYWSLDEAVFK